MDLQGHSQGSPGDAELPGRMQLACQPWVI